MKAIAWYLGLAALVVLVAMMLSESGSAQDPVCQTITMDESGNLTHLTVDCATLPHYPDKTQWHTMSSVRHHNWFYRHPVATGLIGGGTFALIWAVTHRYSCPHYINGVPYDGTPPCPVYCDSPGHCDWSPTK